MQKCGEKIQAKVEKAPQSLGSQSHHSEKEVSGHFGNALPYETHTEISGGYRKKYIDILGMQFCYKKTEKKLKKKSNQNLAAQNAHIPVPVP